MVVTTDSSQYNPPIWANEKNTGCLGHLGDYTAQLYGDYNKPINKDPYEPISILESTPWKTSEHPLKINGWFRCISYWT